MLLNLIPVCYPQPVARTVQGSRLPLYIACKMSKYSLASSFQPKSLHTFSLSIYVLCVFSIYFLSPWLFLMNINMNVRTEQFSLASCYFLFGPDTRISTQFSTHLPCVMISLFSLLGRIYRVIHEGPQQSVAY